VETKWTPGPWEKMLGTHGRNKVCASYSCINGLSALFTIADVNVPEESERGYTDDAFNPDVAAANTSLIAAAPDLYAALEGVLGAMLLSSSFSFDTLTRNASEAGYAALAKARGEA
jgi:hypothetical protein